MTMGTTKKFSNKNKATRSQIYSICNELADKVKELLDIFKIEYIEFDNRIAFCCPVHGGDNPEGACIYTDGNHSKGNWQCWTHCCEKDHGKNIIGFVKGVLEHREGKSIDFGKALTFCLNFLDKKITDVPNESMSETIHDMNKITSVIIKKSENTVSDISREMIIKSLEIPSKYYIERGYKQETLVAFDVGECYNPSKQMFNRAVAPIYDSELNYIGCVGRTLEENNKKYKWVNSKGFKKSFSLYGMWIAKKYIQNTLTVILVEGQGDVWRLYESGIKNSVGIFGSDLSDEQLITLEESGAFNVVILTDTDEAGEKAFKNILNKCGRRFNYYRPKISKKDIGEMSIEEINNELKPQIKGLF